MHITPSEALAKLKDSDHPFTTLFQHGSLEVEVYRPVKVDLQTPHTRDEIYVIISGQGTFFHEGETKKIAAGDFLFVPAGDDHRFENFTDDFSTWVFFYGPEGGEFGQSVDG